VTLDDGTTLALAPGIAQCLEGFGANRPPVHFGFVLHWLRLALAPDTPTAFAPLQAALRETGGSLRNLGALLAELCQALPRAPGHVDTRETAALLRNPGALVEVHFLSRAGTSPPLSGEAFEAHLARMLDAFDAATLRHWLRHGRGPVLKQPARVLPPLPPVPPRTLEGALDELLRRERLRGVTPFLAQMVSALTLPPRHARPASLPVGGYSSVTSRGQPDQILPHEFAGDELEFLRRYAENELLYWQREEPQSQVREDTIVLLDQGVRTWGETRLALAAAAIALGHRARRRGSPVRYAGTFNDGVPLDPLVARADELGQVLDASDLSPNPGLALERVLEEPAPGARDVVLLTHPLSLDSDDVRAASRRAAPGTRVFALTLDHDGNAALCELRRGAPVNLRTFRVEFAASPPATESRAEPGRPWAGDVGTLPCPFRFSIAGTVSHLALDTEGTRLFVNSTSGLTQVFSPDGEPLETLPTPVLGTQPLRICNGLVGVRGGVVALLAHPLGPAAAHFDFLTRHVRALRLPGMSGALPVLAAYDSRTHCVHAISIEPSGSCVAVFDLAAGTARGMASHEPMPEVLALSGMAPRVNVVHQPRAADFDARARSPAQGQFVLLNPTEGRLAVLQPGTIWRPWRPLRDGQPLLKDCFVLEAALAGPALLLRVRRRNLECELHAFAGPDWRYLGGMKTQRDSHGLALDAGGAVAALRTGQSEITLAHVDQILHPAANLRGGKTHSELDLAVGDRWLTVHGGKFTHLLRWDRDRLEISFLQGRQDIHAFQRRAKEHASLNPACAVARPGVRPGNLKTEPAHFRTVAQSPAGAVFATDHLGQVYVFGRDGKPAAMLFVYRSTVAAWLPDGTRYGPAGITGGPTSPGALQRIGNALKTAGDMS
jgi:hypothetical protein